LLKKLTPSLVEVGWKPFFGPSPLARPHSYGARIGVEIRYDQLRQLAIASAGLARRLYQFRNSDGSVDKPRFASATVRIAEPRRVNAF